MMENYKHTTVLLDEAVNGLNIRPDGIYIDGTFGRGGHSRLILSQLGEEGRLLAIDRDPQAIAVAKTIDDPRFSIICPIAPSARIIAGLRYLKAKSKPSATKSCISCTDAGASTINR